LLPGVTQLVSSAADVYTLACDRGQAKPTGQVAGRSGSERRAAQRIQKQSMQRRITPFVDRPMAGNGNQKASFALHVAGLALRI